MVAILSFNSSSSSGFDSLLVKLASVSSESVFDRISWFSSSSIDGRSSSDKDSKPLPSESLSAVKSSAASSTVYRYLDMSVIYICTSALKKQSNYIC